MTEMTAPATQVGSRKRLTGDEVWEVAAAEYRRMLELMRTLGDGDWKRPTDCTAWDVRAMVGHVAGAAEGFGSPVAAAVYGRRSSGPASCSDPEPPRRRSRRCPKATGEASGAFGRSSPTITTRSKSG